MLLGDFDLDQWFTQYAARMSYVHFKDLGPDRRFIETGHGRVDFPALWHVLQDAGFDGWIITDLDYTCLEPEDSSCICLSYLTNTLGIPTASSRQTSC